MQIVDFLKKNDTIDLVPFTLKKGLSSSHDKYMNKLEKLNKYKLALCLYDAMDKLIKKYNPCKIRNKKCVRGRMCCADCEYLSDTGCITKCLTCKLWFCTHVDKHKYPKLFRAIEKINITCWNYGIPLLHRKPISDENNE